MSQLAEGRTEMDPIVHDINLISEALDRIHMNVHDRDPIDRLRVYRAVGQIAAGVLEISDITLVTADDTEQSTIPHLAQVEPLQQLDVELKKTDEITPDPVVLENKVREIEEELKFPVVQESPSEAVTGKESTDIDKVKAYFSEIKLTDREAAMLKNLCLKSGEKARASDLYEGIEGSLGARKQTATRLIKKLAESPYGQYLTVAGNKAGTRYLWQGHGFELESSHNEADIDVRSDELTDGLEINLHEEKDSNAEVDVFSELSKIGIETNDEYEYLAVFGIDLKLSPLARKVIIQIVRQGGETTFRELVNDEELVGSSGSQAAKDLSNALTEISHQLQQHDIAWYDAKIPSPKGDGRHIRKIVIGRTVSVPVESTQQQPAFLAPGSK